MAFPNPWLLFFFTTPVRWPVLRTWSRAQCKKMNRQWTELPGRTCWKRWPTQGQVGHSGTLGVAEAGVPQWKQRQPEGGGGELSESCCGGGSHGSWQGLGLWWEQAMDKERLRPLLWIFPRTPCSSLFFHIKVNFASITIMSLIRFRNTERKSFPVSLFSVTKELRSTLAMEAGWYARETEARRALVRGQPRI